MQVNRTFLRFDRDNKTASDTFRFWGEGEVDNHPFLGGHSIVPRSRRLGGSMMEGFQNIIKLKLNISPIHLPSNPRLFSSTFDHNTKFQPLNIRLTYFLCLKINIGAYLVEEYKINMGFRYKIRVQRCNDEIIR